MIEGFEHERVVIIDRPDVPLRAAIAIHSTALGPALGGLRLKYYPGGLPEAVGDVLRLSRAMTLKAAAAGLDLGGGKAVIVAGADDTDTRNEDGLLALAEEVDALGGRYITSLDIGSGPAEMDIIAKRTKWVVGRSQPGHGDPSESTAETVLAAIMAGLRHSTGIPDVDGRRIAIAGVGKVGAHLARKLAAAGADLTITDLDTARRDALAAQLHCRSVDTVAALHSTYMDVFAPCAAGGMIDHEVATRIQCRVVSGAANNPLSDDAVAAVLAGRKILYVPDFLANCGGLVHVAQELHGFDADARAAAIARAGDRIDAILTEARLTDETPLAIAERQAWARVRAGADRLHRSRQHDRSVNARHAEYPDDDERRRRGSLRPRS